MQLTTWNAVDIIIMTLTADEAVTSAGQDNQRCHVTYGDVIDKAARKNISICRGQDGQGLSHRVYVSQSNSLQIVYNTPTTASTTQHHQHNFIIHVEGERFSWRNCRFCVELISLLSLLLLFLIVHTLLYFLIMKPLSSFNPCYPRHYHFGILSLSNFPTASVGLSMHSTHGGDGVLSRYCCSSRQKSSTLSSDSTQRNDHSRCLYCLCNLPLRLTQFPIFNGKKNEYQPKRDIDWAQQLG